jgi:hypothetical protein
LVILVVASDIVTITRFGWQRVLLNPVRAIRDRNPHRLPAGDYLDQAPDAELNASSLILIATYLPRSRGGRMILFRST